MSGLLEFPMVVLSGMTSQPRTPKGVQLPPSLVLLGKQILYFERYAKLMAPDWAILNALVNTASGATWVSFHHGGGVGIGRSIHAGQVTVADGTPLAAQKIERVLTNDPGMGVIRHVDAGYERAVEVAAERGVRVPMQEGCKVTRQQRSGMSAIQINALLFSSSLTRAVIGSPNAPGTGRELNLVDPTDGSDLVFEGTTNQDFAAFDARTGRQLWSYPIQSSHWRLAVEVGGQDSRPASRLPRTNGSSPKCSHSAARNAAG